MKSYLRASVLAVLVFGIGQSVSAQETVLDIGFSDGYTADTALKDQQGWTQSGTNATTNFVIEGGLLRIKTDTVGNQFLFKEIPVQKGIVTVTWEWQYEGNGTANANFGLGLMDLGNINAGTNNNIVDYNELSAYGRMADGSYNSTISVDARYGDLVGGGNFRADVPVAYKDGVKIHMRLVIDVANQMYDAFAQREGEAEVQIINDVLFRRGVSTANQGLNAVVIFDNNTSATGPSVTVDNIKITSSAPTEIVDWTIME